MTDLRTSLLAIATLSLFTALPASADQAHHPKAATSAPASAEMATGEIRKIDLDTARITLKHGEIKSLDMPPMTMVFVVKDKALLGPLKAGDKVRFKAVNDNGKYTVTEIVAAP